MTEWTRFPRAPILEALLDIRVILPPNVKLDRLATLQDRCSDRYPQRRERIMWEAQWTVKEGSMESAAAKGGPDGYIFTSENGKQLFQARFDGFTFNRLRPYDRWESFRDEAMELWKHYLAIAQPESVTRIALRYINELNLPLPIRDFKDYILTTPEIAPEMPQGLRTFFIRLEIPDPESETVAIITETMKPPQVDVLPLIFDIDVFQEQTLDPHEAKIWETFEHLREFKNRIFFNSITDKAKGLFT